MYIHFVSICKSLSNEHEDNANQQDRCDFERSVNADELEDIDLKDQTLPPDLVRLIE